MNSPWEISPDEHAVSRVQFIAAGPQNGKLTATQAREVLLKSGLPQNILAQIWALSDLDKDGHLDEREFSIAIKLTRTALAGFPLPPQLPQTMLQISPASSMPVMPPPMRPPPMPPMSQFNTAPPAVMQNVLRTGFSTGPWKTGRDCGNWVVPHQKKLHFAQQFNQLDKERVGWLSGNVARNVMGQSGLPMPTLAHIWNLSDVNKDGRLNVDEFCIAIHLIEMHKEGYALPDTTPHDLVLLCGGDRAQTESPHLEPGAPPPQKVTTPRTFEDKRKDNYDKGQAELERRRQILQEEEDRRRADIAKKEREEFERRERERMEKERRAEEMRRAEEERMRALEEQRMEEEKKREAERETQRKAQEKIRMAEMEKVRIKEMQSAKEREAEQTAQRQQRQKTLGFQLQALDEKTADMNENITEARKKIEEITKEIEGMRGERDEKMKRIQQLHTQHQQMAVKSQELAHALLQLQSANRETTTQLDEIDRTQTRAAETRVLVGKLKEEVEEVRERTETQTALLAKKEETLEQQRPDFEAFKADYTEALRLLTKLQIEARQKVEEKRRLAQQQGFQSKQPSQESFSNVQNPFQHTETTSLTHGTSNQLPSTASSTGTSKYRAKYEFQGRTEDELSFSEGDVILVFEGHASEPGWLAGQIKDRVGWFPAAFADPLAPINPTITQPIQSASEVATSPSLERIAEEEPVETVASILQKTNLVSTMGAPVSSSAHVICVCTAQFAWRARNEEDLSFSKGDQIEVIEQQEMKWKGKKVDGSVGWFPKSYVKIDKASSAQTNGNIQALPPAYDTPPGDIPPSISQQAIKQQQSITSPPPPIYDAPPGDFSAAVIPAYDTPPGGDVITSTSQHSLAEAAWKAPSNDQPNGEWFVAVFDFDAVEDGDLALKTGDRILVIQQQEQWWRGISQGREGVFPANYVQKAEATNGQSASSFHGTERAKAIVEFTASAPNQLALRPGDIITVRQKSEQGWWEGETVRNGTIHAGWFPGNYVQVEEQTVLSPSGDLAVAQFDYEATQHDELSFKAGDKIFVTSKHDVEWWAGHLQESPSRSGLFPSAYVQMHVGGPLQNTEQDQRPNIISSASSHHPHKSQKLIQLTQELLISEEKYLHDLETASRIFIRPLSKVISPTEIEVLSMNWDQLVKLSKGITQRLKQGQTPGSALLSEIEGLQQFIGFCSKQQVAVDVLEKLLKDSSIQRIYSTCCQNPAARGMSLHTLFLVPLGRITRYPLLIEKMIEASAPDSSDIASLDMALSVTKSILEEINRSINESDTMCFLGWCQSHLRVSIQPPLEFAAPTRFLGSRRVLHSGVLWKARSGKVLISILFNDFLLLATPNEPIHDPSTFKLSHQSDIHLTTYRQPFLLNQIIVTKDEIDTNFTLHNDTYKEECKLKAASGNACRLWLSHLGPAIETAHQRAKPRTSSTTRPPIGRLLVEVVAVESGGVKTLNPHSLLTIRLGLHDSIECFQVDPSRAEIKQSTQFTFTETGGMLRVALLEPRVFSPDVPLYDEMAIPLPQLIADCSQHRGPIRKTIQLFQGSNGTNSTKKQKAIIQMKFVVHIYESAL